LDNCKSTFSRSDSPNLTETDIINIQIAMIAVKSKISVKWDDSAKQKAELLDIIFKIFLNTKDPKIKNSLFRTFYQNRCSASWSEHKIKL
jgi:hypothetical protein